MIETPPRPPAGRLWYLPLLIGVLSSLLLALSVYRPARALPHSSPPAGPPVAAVRPITDEYFGTKVVDPYRYMENLNDPEVIKWFKEQDEYTRAVLAQIPGRTSLLARIQQLDQAAPFRVSNIQRMLGEKYFYEKRLAGEVVDKLYAREGLEGVEKLLVDPDKFATTPGTHYDISFFSPSYDSRYVAYGVSPGGSEDAVIRIMDVATGHDTGETIDRSWYAGISWLPDNRSFVHIRLQEMKPGMDPAERRLKTRVYLHRVGTSADSDIPVFGYDVDPAIKLAPSEGSAVSIDPRSPLALACYVRGFENDQICYTAPLDALPKPGIPWRKIFDKSDQITNIDFRGDDFYLLTHKNAPRFKIIRTSLSHPDIDHAETILPASDAVLTNLFAASDALYVLENDGPVGKLLRVPYATGPSEQIPLPVNGTISFASSDPRLHDFLLYLEGWTRTYNIYQYEPSARRVHTLGLQPFGPFDAPEDIQAVEVKVPSHDGVLIPLSILHKKGIKLDGSHPVLLDGYGAYAIKQDPYFSPRFIAWLERGGILAFAHVRGGGEYGEEWHEAGKLKNKPNTWKDFIACAEYLVSQHYTTPQHLAGSGGSAGGILIGRAFTERPDLFAAALDDVGLSDMIRDMYSPDGPLNVTEYGGLDSSDGFHNLLEISAYYHVRDGVRYPAILLTTGINDPRVVPWEPGKMAARLQAATAGPKPILLRVDYQGGHGGIGSTLAQYEQYIADRWSFLLWQLGADGFQPLH